MNFYWKIGRLLLGYLVGILCFFLLNLFWGDDASAILWTTAVWLPIHFIYASLLLFLSSRKAWPSLPGILEVNGFLIAMCPFVGIWPQYMARFDFAGIITIFHLVIFSVVNMVMIGFHKLLKGRAGSTNKATNAGGMPTQR
jgi:hypothetical protein